MARDAASAGQMLKSLQRLLNPIGREDRGLEEIGFKPGYLQAKMSCTNKNISLQGKNKNNQSEESLRQHQ